MTFGRIVLGITGLAFAGYGLVCLFVPTLVADYSGMLLPDASALTEVVAMYGGLQTGMGALFLFAALRPAHLREGLFVLTVLVGSLAFARSMGLMAHGATPYNLGAVVYELTTTALAVIALRMDAGQQAIG
jgi:hypothetical protein